MTEDEYDNARNEVLEVLISARDDVGERIWLDRRYLASQIRSPLGLRELVSVVGALNQLDYVEIDRDLKPGDRILDFSDIRLTSTGERFLDSGRRFVVDLENLNRDRLAADRKLPRDLPSGYIFTEAKRVEVVAALREAEKHLMELPPANTERAQAHGYLIAAITLAEMPDPPPSLIWEILSRASALAGVASLFVAVLAIFLQK